LKLQFHYIIILHFSALHYQYTTTITATNTTITTATTAATTTTTLQLQQHQISYSDKLQPHYKTTTTTTATTTTPLHYTTLHFTALHHHYTTPPLHYTTTTTTTAASTTTLQLQLQQQVLQPQLHYNTTTTATATTITLHYTTPHYIQQLWLGWPLQPFEKAQLQPPFGPSVGSLCHPCITTTHLSYSVLSLKLPPPPCAVLLVDRSTLAIHCCIVQNLYIYITYIYCYYWNK